MYRLEKKNKNIVISKFKIADQKWRDNPEIEKVFG